MCYSFPSIILTVLIIHQFSFIKCQDHLIEVACRTSSDCDTFVKPDGIIQSTCVSGQCLCLDDDSNQVDCIPAHSALNNIIGGKCPCTMKNAVCKEQLCACRANFTASIDRRRCLKKIVALDNECENDFQCHKHDPFSQCVNKNCSCAPRFTLYNGTCYGLTGLKHTCQTNEECDIEVKDSVCRDKKCLCKEGLVTTPDMMECLASVKYGEKCTDGAQCKVDLGPGGTCENGICTCNEDFYYIKYHLGVNETRNVCELRKAVGNTCSADKDCYEFHKMESEQSMQCFLFECICRPGHDQVGQYCRARSNGNRVVPVLEIFAFLIVILKYFC